tara:strand:+ start:1831 stop:2826 length:996 start_codon:yes stop_codon:yes gene_type:complete
LAGFDKKRVVVKKSPGLSQIFWQHSDPRQFTPTTVMALAVANIPRAYRRLSRPSLFQRRAGASRASRGAPVRVAKKREGILFGGETSPPLPPSFDEDEADEDDSYSCAIAYAEVDNDAHPTSTLLKVDVSAVPGVMRILSWLLNGLDLELNDADWEIEEDVDDDGSNNDIVHIKMFVTEGIGKGKSKVNDPRAVEERVTEYLRFCTQAESKKVGVVEHSGIRIDNKTDPERTLLTVRVNETGAKSLLSVASTITGLGLRMNRAKFGVSKPSGASIWEMKLTDFESRNKLTSAQVQGLLYTLALVFNNSKGFSGADYLVEKMTSFDDGDFSA